MKIHQLFREKVPEDLADKIATCFGLRSIHDGSMFCKDDLVKQNTVAHLLSMIDDVRHFYLPCKAKVYLVGIDESKAITIFRQVIRLYGKNLNSIQKYIKYKKVTYYYVSDSVEITRNIKMTNNNITVSFD